MPGPPKKPTQLKILQGTFRKDREPENEPEPEKIEEEINPPSHLSWMAKKKWKELVPELIELGLLTNIDLGALEICREAYAMAIEAKKAIYSLLMIMRKSVKDEQI